MTDIGSLHPDERSLTSALRAVAADDDHVGASAAVEARVMAEARSIARARRRHARVATLAAAAVVFAGIALQLWSRLDDRRSPADSAAAAAIDVASAEVMTEFFPLTYSSVPASDGQVVRMQVPRAALARFGVASFHAAGDRSPTVMAEVMVGHDGLARAVRFVRAAGLDEQKEQKQ